MYNKIIKIHQGLFDGSIADNSSCCHDFERLIVMIRKFKVVKIC
jgi:hypothetical protein